MRRAVVFAEELFEEYHYASNAFNVDFATDVFTTAGRPYVAGQNWHVIVDPGVIIGSTSVASPAATTGTFPRFLKLTVRGRIQGAGGAGGNGAQDNDSKSGGYGGGGGGGAGCEPSSVGGEGAGPADDGAPGTTEAGGVGGAGRIWDASTGSVQFTPGEHGGDALSIDTDVRLIVESGGKIYGGGGGGGGGGANYAQFEDPGVRQGGHGGGPGEVGQVGQQATGGQGGDAGKAIALNGHTVSVLTYPNDAIKGEVA